MSGSRLVNFKDDNTKHVKIFNKAPKRVSSKYKGYRAYPNDLANLENLVKNVQEHFEESEIKESDIIRALFALGKKFTSEEIAETIKELRSYR